ncbi:MAG: dihydroorotate dehydrogenase electron transfer subunit [Methanomicrobiaceae archaeon]|nr:dihydroorotate dehydrogenase electron transfer subunit [Methanomicrobiaceae archaeon]
MHEYASVPVTITRIIDETPGIKTFEFSHAFTFRPGQFVMVWVPGVDEIPMALSSPWSISVLKVGDATAALFACEEGDMLGIKGPLGNGFSVGGRTLAVAGGIGAAPLRHLAIEGSVETFLLGARTAAELPFAREIARMTDLVVATDDGSEGHHGFVTDLCATIDLTSYDRVCVCGPEIMMRAVLRLLDEAGCADRGQFSLHRYMKCGVGICGSCCIDPSGLCVCSDGPVFSGDLLLGSEFGAYTRDASGRKKAL